MPQMKMFLVGLVAVSALPLFGTVTRADEPVFERDVLPVLAAHCLTCHGGIRQRGGLDLRTPESVLTGGKSGTAIVAGSAEKSLLWKKILVSYSYCTKISC